MKTDKSNDPMETLNMFEYFEQIEKEVDAKVINALKTHEDFFISVVKLKIFLKYKLSEKGYNEEDKNEMIWNGVFGYLQQKYSMIVNQYINKDENAIGLDILVISLRGVEPKPLNQISNKELLIDSGEVKIHAIH